MGQTTHTSKAASFWDFAAAAVQGRQDEAEILWERLPDEDRAYLVAALERPDLLVKVEAKLNAPLLVIGTE
jgi:hypothetical protein